MPVNKEDELAQLSEEFPEQAIIHEFDDGLLIYWPM